MRQNTNVYEIWQRNFYERIIRNENELNNIREYIRSNPALWKTDDLHVPKTMQKKYIQRGPA
jgi:REP element-mobilizing transposase RayT